MYDLPDKPFISPPGVLFFVKVRRCINRTFGWPLFPHHFLHLAHALIARPLNPKPQTYHDNIAADSQHTDTNPSGIDSKTTAVLLLPIFVPTAVAALILVLEITS